MAEQFYEIAVEGPTGKTLGFVQGFVAARGEGGRVLDAYEEGFDCESLRERIRELFHPSKQTYHLLVPADVVPMVTEAVDEGKRRGLGISLCAQRALAGARFAFTFETFSRAHAPALRALFDPAPAGVTIDDLSIEENVRPEDKGVEAYAPAHDYQLKGSGTARGDVRAVLQLHRACRDEQLIQQRDLELLGAD